MPVFAVKASITFWKASRSPPPHWAMTVIVPFAAADADAVGLPELCAAGCCVQAATSATTNAIGISESLRGTNVAIGLSSPGVEAPTLGAPNGPVKSRRYRHPGGYD